MSDEIKIESDIPVPSIPRAEAARYPWDEMRVGDSFLVPRINGEPIGLVRDRANKAVQYAAKKKQHRYCTRSGETGTRIWRIE